MNNKRRNRSNVGRSRSPELLVDGVYSNQSFTHAATSLMGTTVQLVTKNGSRFEGIFTAFSSQFEIVLDYVHVLEPNENADKPKRRIVFPHENIVQMHIKNVDTNYASRDGGFQTDSSISKYDRNGQANLGEKELQPWVSDCNGEEIELTMDSEIGWDPNTMFKINEEMYGVRSNFDHSLTGYTTTIERSESKNFKDAEARANRIASEIEKNPKAQARLEMENGDEEERFAAVIRPSEGPDKGKYIPPGRRQGPSNLTRPSARSSPFPPGRSPSTPSAEETPESSPTSGSVTTDTISPAASKSSDDSRNNNSPSGSSAAATPPVNTASLPPSSHPPRSNNNGTRGKPHVMQNYAYSQPPRFPPSHPPMVQPRPIPPNAVATQPPPQPIPHVSQTIPIVYPQPIPPGHAHQPPNAMPPESIPQAHPPAQPVAMMHTMEQAPIAHVHMPPHGVPHVHSVVPGQHIPFQPQSQPPPRDPREQHEMDLRGHRGVGIRGQSPRVFQHNNNKRFPMPLQPHPPSRKPRSEEVSELAEFSSNLKLAGDEDAEEKQESPPLEQWNKGRSPPSNISSDDATSALKKSTLNPNAKEFVFNPGAKSFTPRPPNTPGPSRPHTPQTPAQPFGYSPVPAVIMPATTYVMPPFSHQAQQPRLQMAPRPDLSSSQMQVAAATGQPLLAPAPMQRFVAPYPNPPPQQYSQMIRMVHGQQPVMFHPEGAQQVQFMSPHGQPHPGGQFQPTQPPQFPVLYSVPLSQASHLYFPQPHPGQGGQQSHVQVIVQNP